MTKPTSPRSTQLVVAEVAARLRLDPALGRPAVERIVAADAAEPRPSLYTEMAAPVLAEAEARLLEVLDGLDALDEAPPIEERN